MQKKKLEVTKKDAGRRLDVFAHARFPEFSRAWIQKLIKEGAVSVGDRRVAPSKKLKEGEAVSLAIRKPEKVSLNKGKIPEIPVVYEDAKLLVVNKPAGVVVHPSASHRKGTLAHWLMAHYPKIKNVGENPLRPGIVHRLDKDASGLMVIAKSQDMFEKLKRMFKNRAVTKKYLVLVRGTVSDAKGVISLPITRSRSDPTRQRVLKIGSAKGREALTTWRVKKRYPGFTLLEVAPKTGRMHQIRVHLSAIGHSVAGDTKYRPRGAKDPAELTRLFLHASFLSFPALKKEWKAPLPLELSRVLKDLDSVVQ